MGSPRRNSGMGVLYRIEGYLDDKTFTLLLQAVEKKGGSRMNWVESAIKEKLDRDRRG